MLLQGNASGSPDKTPLYAIYQQQKMDNATYNDKKAKTHHAK